jgi:CheY-like chemotaxis protein
MEALPVCVVEDSPPIRKLMEVLLTRAGFSVVSFSGVADAVAWLQQHRPAAVLCDLVLPDGNGADVLRVVRALPEGERIPVIAVTGLAQESDREHYLRAGFDAYIVKPLSTATFAYEVQRIMEQKLHSVSA